jgi:4-carboxymuconolactone decarboxylase
MSDKGLEVLHQMLGKERTEEIREVWSKLSPDFSRLVSEFVAGEVWSRPGLELKTRSLITVAALTATGRPNALRLNIEMALNNGATRAEILETILHMAVYAGFPACWDALVIADEAFRKQTDDDQTDN